MNAFCTWFAARALGAGCMLVMVAAPAAATIEWRIDPLTLPPLLRQQALTAPLGEYDPWGRPADAGCLWSRIQIPTAQGLRWMLEEECDDLGTWR